jgi:hypothetical protein
MITRRQLLQRGAAGGTALTLFRTVPAFGAPKLFAQPLSMPETAGSTGQDAAGNDWTSS